MKRIITLIITIAILCTASIPAFAAEMPYCRVSLTPSHLTAEVGDEIKISLVFENASQYPYGLAAFCASLAYDKDAVRLESIKSAAPRSDVTSSNKAGLAKALYVFASATAKSGFNKDTAFLTATFTVLDSNIDKADFSVTFDSITVSDYTDGNRVTNYQVDFNSPTVSVDIIGNKPPSAESAVSASDSSQPTSNNVQSKPTASSSSQATDTESVQSEVQGTVSESSATLNSDFTDVEQSDGDKISVDKFDREGNLVEETEEELKPTDVPTESNSHSVQSTASDTASPDNASGVAMTAMIIIIVLIAAIISVALAVILIKANKKKE